MNGAKTRWNRTPVVEGLESRELLSSYFVSPSGSDSARGSINAPWHSIQHALDVARSGDVINLRQGTYDGGITIRKPNLTLQSYSGESATIHTPFDDASIVNNITIGEDASGTKLLNLDISGGFYYAVKTESLWDTGAPREYAATDLLIRGCTIHDSGRDVVKLTPGSDDVTIEKTEIYNSGRRDPGNAEGIDGVNVDNFVLRDSYVHDTTTNGVYLKGGSINTLIERNRIANTAHSGILLGQSSDENLFDTRVNPGYYESIDGVVRNNVIWNTQGAGMGAWAAKNAQFYNNTLVNVAQSMMGGVIITGQEHWIPNERIVPSSDVTLANNIVIVKSGLPAVTIREGGLAGSLTTSNNRYFSPGGAKFQDSRDREPFRGNLAAWKNRFGDSGSTEGDPRIDDRGRLLSGSPAINAGRAIDGFSDDRDGQKRTGAWDIGADEIAATVTTAPKPRPTPVVSEPNTHPGLTATYFNGLNFSGEKIVRTDGKVNFRWSDSSPADGIGNDTFSVRWTGKVRPRFSETYTFYTASDDGVRLWVNGKRIINDWNSHGVARNKGTITLKGGVAYNIRMEYYNKGGDATARLLWSSPSQSKGIIPRDRLSTL